MTARSETADRPARILIVDDERRNPELLEVMLESEGHVVQVCASGEEALAIIGTQPPDLVLLDIMMPGMDGYQVTAAIKDNPATRSIPVVLVTALDDRGSRMLGLNAGAEDFLTKPVDRAELFARVRNLLRLKAAIEDAKEARRMAEHANSAKTAFLRAMSHELRTPLNAITGYTELLELGIRGAVNSDQTQDLGRIKRASSYLLRLINDVLAVARLEGTRPLELTSIAANPVLEEVEGLCALQAKAKGVTLTVAPTTGDCRVTADAERFQQILLNLIVNAIKFSSAGGTISVSCGGDGSTVRILVSDNGVGIRAADVDRVFEPFVQIDRHLTTAAQQGLGLGLSISRDLARAMAGDLTLASIEGVGSTFTLTLPAAPEREPGAPVTPARERRALA